MLLSLVCFSLSFWNFLFHMENWMDHLDYRCVHELVPESNSLLLAYSPSSGCSCEDGKIYVMHHHWLISKTLCLCQTILASKCSDKLRLSWLNSAKNPNLYKKLNQSGTSENVVKLVRLRHLGFKSRDRTGKFLPFVYTQNAFKIWEFPKPIVMSITK